MYIPILSDIQYLAEKLWGYLFRPDDVPSEIVPGLWLGGFIRSGKVAETAVVDLCEEHEDRLSGIRFTVWAPIAERLPVAYLLSSLFCSWFHSSNSCNAGLGCFRDNVDLMMTAIEYLKFHST